MQRFFFAQIYSRVRYTVSLAKGAMMQTKTKVITISSYSKKGAARGQTQEDTRPFELRSAHLGEEVLIEVLKRKKGVKKAKLLEVIKPSEQRVNPICKHASVCGGCVWQHLKYQEQLQIKQKVIEGLYQHVAKTIFPIITCDAPFHYRNKMEFSFSQDKAQNKYLGLIEADSKGKVLNLTECHLTNDWFAKTLVAVREFWEKSDIRAYHRMKGEGTLETLTLREGMNTKERLIMLTISGSSLHSLTNADLKRFKEALLSVSENEKASVFLQIIHRKKGLQTQASEMNLQGKDHFVEKLTITYPDQEKKEFLFKVSPSSFFQPNTKQAEKLFSRALEIVGLKPRKVILDLFCGTATLGMIFSRLADKVVGVEINPYAVFDGEVNLETNRIENVSLHKGDVAKVLPMLDLKDVDLMIVDPPRSGLGKHLLEKGLFAKPKEILYISCNPYTQKEDIEFLLQMGYELEAVQSVDQFPQTAHQEVIAYLKKIP